MKRSQRDQKSVRKTAKAGKKALICAKQQYFTKTPVFSVMLVTAKHVTEIANLIIYISQDNIR